jgi:hypothetical protein
MITTTLKWFTPAEQLPDDEVLLMTSRGMGEVTLGYLMGGDWFMETDELVSRPDFWAHIPAGPEA